MHTRTHLLVPTRALLSEASTTLSNAVETTTATAKRRSARQTSVHAQLVAGMSLQIVYLLATSLCTSAWLHSGRRMLPDAGAWEALGLL